ncbi:MAG TPA: FAD-dependent oxidoreductase [Aggregatilineales bacterium]|nr:FAD-dependent oxidoreductase [Aggregatilineales bacterium]
MTARPDYADKSFWLETAGSYEERPSLTTAIQADVTIVGGGFTGLSTAYHVKRAQPGLRVVLLESHVIGYGASGRNAGFAMTLFGLTLGVTRSLFGREKAADAHRYMERAVDYVGELVERHDLDCSYERPGFLRVATTEGYARRIQEEIELAHRLGLEGMTWLSAGEVAEQVCSPLYLGAWWEPRCALVNPARLARELRRVCLELGVEIYERTPVIEVERGQSITARAPRGRVRTERLVLATNAWSHLIPQIRRKQVPAWTYVVLTEPLEPRHFDAIGWRNRQGVEDARNLVHYYRLTPDNRLLMGGGDVAVSYGADMDRDTHYATWRHLAGHIAQVFPPLKGVRITHRWGGPVSVPVDMAPAIGTVGDERVIYSAGCMGHGVSLTHLNGLTIAQMLRGEQTELTGVFFVNRRTIPWPSEPLRWVASAAIRGYLRLEDRLYERGMPPATHALRIEPDV